MIDLHKELLAAIEAAEAKARALYAKGAGVEKIVQQVHQAGNAVKERLRAYAAAATQAKEVQAPESKAKGPGKAVKPPGTPEALEPGAK